MPETAKVMSPSRTLELRPPRTWPAPLAGHFAGLRQIEQVSDNLAVDDDSVLRSLGVGLGGALDWLAELLARVDFTSIELRGVKSLIQIDRGRLADCLDAEPALVCLAEVEARLRQSPRTFARGQSMRIALDLLYAEVKAISARQDWLELKEGK